MSEMHRRAGVLLGLCLAYTLLFVPPNATGAADSNMLSVFELDEFGQFHVLWRMTEQSDDAGEALHRFVAYDHYYYGFPFFAVSAAVFWPLRSSYLASGEPGLVATSALLLRELSPLFTALAIAILVALWTRLRSLPRMLALFAFLGAIPAVVGNDLWWHPDALVLLWICATLGALSLDDRRLGGWFHAAALACGLATATKTVGLWFFAAVGLHLVRARGARPPADLARAAAGFVAVMALAIAVASPHYFLPSEWDEIARAISTWRQGIEVGWDRVGRADVRRWAGVLSHGYGWLATWLALLGLGVATALRAPERRERDLAATILAWVVPLGLFLAWKVALQTERYLLPVLVPLASCAGSPLLWRSLAARTSGRAVRPLAVALLCLLAVQLALFVAEDARRYRAVLEREATSPSLAFWRRLDAEVLSALPPDVPLRIFRDLYVYVPPERRFEVHARWAATEQAYIEASRPDLILLRRSEIERYAQPDAVASSTDPERARRAHHFYRDAARDAIPGYRRLLTTDFAVAFGREAPPDGGPRAALTTPPSG